MKRFLLLLLLCCLTTIGLLADGTIRDGQSELYWYTDDTDPEDNGEMDWELDDSGTDQAYQLWFWYRINQQGVETALPPPDTESFVGNTALLKWTNLHGLNFDVAITAVIKDKLGNAASLSITTQVTNKTGSELSLNFFQYMDLDKGDSSDEDEARLIGTDLIEIKDLGTGDICQFAGVDASAYQVLEYSDLLDLLVDAQKTDLDNTGLPFVAEDWTGAFQWVLTIPAGATRSILAGTGGNQASPVKTVSKMVIPTMGKWALFILGLLLVNLALFFIQRNRLPTST
ncbi:MAG: hypothetical protein AAGJ18_15780 [Bacteroidota bacterium]